MSRTSSIISLRSLWLVRNVCLSHARIRNWKNQWTNLKSWPTIPLNYRTYHESTFMLVLVSLPCDASAGSRAKCNITLPHMHMRITAKIASCSFCMHDLFHYEAYLLRYAVHYYYYPPSKSCKWQQSEPLLAPMHLSLQVIFW